MAPVLTLLAALGQSIPQLLRTLFGALLSLVAPPCCAACGCRLHAEAVFCAPCAATVVTASGVERIDIAADAGAHRRGVAVALVAFAHYGGAVAEAVRRLKFHNRPDLARPLGELLRRAVPRLERLGQLGGASERYDLVVPVPLHGRRLAARGYNQAALIATALARDLGVPMRTSVLVRTAFTSPQASLGATARHHNLRSAFAVHRPELVRNRRVLLVDDVATTATTLGTCAEALAAAGATRVDAVVLAIAERQRPAANASARRITASW